MAVKRDLVRYFSLSIVRVIYALLLVTITACSDEHSAPANLNAQLDIDIQLVDDYLDKWDRFAQGEDELLQEINARQTAFEESLARMLEADDRRAPARLVFYAVVQVGGSVPASSALGLAWAGVVGSSVQTFTMADGAVVYFAGDLYHWWEQHGREYEPYPLYEDWLTRDFAQRVVIPTYQRMERH